MPNRFRASSERVEYALEACRLDCAEQRADRHRPLAQSEVVCEYAHAGCHAFTKSMCVCARSRGEYAVLDQKQRDLVPVPPQ
jgi:hypothetical protein